MTQQEIALLLVLSAGMLILLGGWGAVYAVRESRFEARRRRRMAFAVGGGGAVPVARAESPVLGGVAAKKSEKMTGAQALFVQAAKASQSWTAKATGIGSDGQRQLRLRLLRAGYRRPEALPVFLFGKLVAPVVGGALLGLAAPMLGAAGINAWLVAAVGALLGFYAIDRVLDDRGKERIGRIRLSLPDALDLMVIAAEAGLTSDAALERVAAEIDGRHVDLAEEMRQLLGDLTRLPVRQSAYEALLARVPLSSLRAVVQVIRQAERAGTPVGPALRVVAAEERKKRMLEAENRAAKIPAMMALPLVCFLLPATFLVLLGPVVIMFRDAFKAF